VREGKPSPKIGGAIHPRTAVALDRARKTLWLVVVDGRQPGTSEGMSLRELADQLVELGAWSAINLDGGGSSVMLLRDGEGPPAVVSRPSTLTLFGRVPRPVPVLLGIRRRAK
jgi:exopolysaccharide biosynthesis protein